MFKKLYFLKKLLDRDKLNLNSIKHAIDDLNYNKYKLKLDYLEDLLYPEKNKRVRIPSKIPVPTCTYNLTSRITLSPNPEGNLIIFINPYFLTTSKMDGRRYDYTMEALNTHRVYIRNLFTKDYTGVCFSNNVGINGKDHLSALFAKDIGMKIEDFYESYRLVSGSVTARYVNTVLDARGTIGGAIIMDKSNEITCKYYIGADTTMHEEYNPDNSFSTSDMPFFFKYGNFDNIRHSIYSRENYILDGIRLLYFPVDNSYEEFIPIYNGKGTEPKQIRKDVTIKPTMEINNGNFVKTGFNWVIYTQNAPFEDNSICLDFCLNFECIPKQEYLDFLPVDVCSSALSLQDKNEIFEIVRNNAIGKNNNKKIIN